MRGSTKLLKKLTQQPDKAARARETAEQWKAIAEKLSTSEQWRAESLDF